MTETTRSPTIKTEPPAYSLSAESVLSGWGTSADTGLTAGEARHRLTTYGPNQITAEKPPSTAAIALAAAAGSDEPDARRGHRGEPRHRRGLDRRSIVGLLILLNVVLGARQELKASAPASTRCRSCRSRRRRWCATAQLALVPAVDARARRHRAVEAGDIVPADGRIIRSATLETQEAALTGESAPVAKDARHARSGRVALGDRTNMVFQNTSVTRGTGVDGRDGHRHADPDGPDRHDAHVGDPDPVAAAEGARLADQGLRDHRLDARSPSSSSSG